jgi:hypothetical protein
MVWLTQATALSQAYTFMASHACVYHGVMDTMVQGVSAHPVTPRNCVVSAYLYTLCTSTPSAVWSGTVYSTQTHALATRTARSLNPTDRGSYGGYRLLLPVGWRAGSAGVPGVLTPGTTMLYIRP